MSSKNIYTLYGYIHAVAKFGESKKKILTYSRMTTKKPWTLDRQFHRWLKSRNQPWLALTDSSFFKGFWFELGSWVLTNFVCFSFSVSITSADRLTSLLSWAFSFAPACPKRVILPGTSNYFTKKSREGKRKASATATISRKLSFNILAKLFLFMSEISYLFFWVYANLATQGSLFGKTQQNYKIFLT